MNDCSPEQPCGHCHPEHAGQRCRITHPEPGVIVVEGSLHSGELRIDITGTVPTINGVRIPSPDILTELAGIFRLLATQRAGLVRRDERYTATTEQMPVNSLVEHADGWLGTVKPDQRLGWAHRTNAHDAVIVRVERSDNSVVWVTPDRLRPVDTAAA